MAYQITLFAEDVTTETSNGGGRCLTPSTMLTPNNAEQAFERFWDAYPRREGSNPKKPAKERFINLVNRKHVDPEIIITKATQYSIARSGENPRYTAMATTWLNQHRFEDDDSTSPGGGGKPTFDDLAMHLSNGLDDGH